jgi:rhodanese-related sulfurtransferase
MIGTHKSRAGRIAALCPPVALALYFLFVTTPAAPQDVWINEIEFAPYIIMPEELLYRIIGGKSDYLILDIREQDSYRNGHIKTAVHYDWSGEGPKSNLEDIPTDREVLIVSKDGSESFELLRYLLQRGYSNVLVVEGGMHNWPYREFLEAGE